MIRSGDVSYGDDTSPPNHTDLPSTAAPDDRLAAYEKATVILAATEMDSNRFEVKGEAGGLWEDNPPTTEPDILAAVMATQHEIASGNLGPTGVMDLVARRAEFLTDATGAVVELLEGDELVYRAASGSAARSIGVRIDCRNSLSGLCIRTGEVMRCDDAEKDGRVDKAACRWVGIRSMVLVPLAHEGHALGVLAVISPALAAFDDRTVWTLRLMADLLSRALTKATVVEAERNSTNGRRPASGSKRG